MFPVFLQIINEIGTASLIMQQSFFQSECMFRLNLKYTSIFERLQEKCLGIDKKTLINHQIVDRFTNMENLFVIEICN